jgi:hypothetical protein
MEQVKIQFLKENECIEFDKKKIRKEFEAKNILTDEYIEEWINRYKYYRTMSDGEKMFYSEEYLNAHSIEEIEDDFVKNK